MTNIFIEFLGFNAIVSAILVISSKNPIMSVLFLIIVFRNISGYLVLLGISFIGISYLIIYIGAIIILFLFVIIILNLQQTELNNIGVNFNKNIPLGIILTRTIIFEIISIITTFIDNNGTHGYFINNKLFIIQNGYINKFNSIYLDIPNITNIISNTIIIPDTEFSNFIQIESLGDNIYTNNSISLIIIRIILLIAIIGPITLAVLPPHNNK